MCFASYKHAFALKRNVNIQDRKANKDLLSRIALSMWCFPKDLIQDIHIIHEMSSLISIG